MLSWQRPRPSHADRDPVIPQHLGELIAYSMRSRLSAANSASAAKCGRSDYWAGLLLLAQIFVTPSYCEPHLTPIFALGTNRTEEIGALIARTATSLDSARAHFARPLRRSERVYSVGSDFGMNRGPIVWQRS